jgi:hypothetical protein
MEENLQKSDGRPPSGNSHPEQTDIKYCIYDKRHNDYGYTDEWVKLLVAEFKDETAYEKLFTKTREPETQPESKKRLKDV